MSLNVHNYEGKLEHELKNLEDAKILPANKKHIGAYRQQQESEGISIARRQRAVSLLRQMAEWLGKDFKKATENDLRNLVSFIQSKKNEKDGNKGFCQAVPLSPSEMAFLPVPAGRVGFSQGFCAAAQKAFILFWGVL